jgi:hypothetical protein
VAGAGVLAGTGGYAAYDIFQIEEGALLGTRLGGNNPLLNSNDSPENWVELHTKNRRIRVPSRR